MIECRVDSRECLCPEDFFVVQRPIWLSELSVSLLRKFSQSLITWQVRLALRLCGLYNSVPQDPQPLDFQIHAVSRFEPRVNFLPKLQQRTRSYRARPEDLSDSQLDRL